MPKWVIICPNCKRQQTYSEVEDAALDSVRRDPVGTRTKPALPEGEKQKCPNCGRDIRVNTCDLTYSYL